MVPTSAAAAAPGDARGAEPGGPSSRTVFVAAYLVLSALGVVQIAMSNLALGYPLHLHGLLYVRSIEAACGLVACVGTLALVRRAADVERVGVVRAYVISLLALVPASAFVAAVPLTMQRLGAEVIFEGSVAAKAVTDLVTAGLALALAVAHDVHRRYRAREAHALQLEARLAEARLQALSSQLRPHYLFNTLNAIAVVMHRDVRAADAMLVGLADLLRATLHEHEGHEIPLAREVALLEQYLAIMRHRFGARLTTEVTVAPEASALLVPPFVLQPLVENALEHGIGQRAGPGVLRVRASRAGDRLRLEVTDDGAGLARAGAGDGADGPTGRGIGLSVTRRRLEQLYGEAQQLTLEPLEQGRGTRAVVELPAREAASA